MPTVTGLASSFINFSRPGASGGGATVTDADGKIKWAGHNLLTNSESFDTSAWVKGGTCTVTANTASAPDGTITADTLTFGGGIAVATQNITLLNGVSYTLGMWVRSVSGTAVFRLTYFNGTSSVISSDFTATTTWQLFTHTVTGSGAAGNVGIREGSATAAATLYAWGAHLYRSDMQMQQNPAMGAGMGSYYPTTPRNLLGYTEDFSNAAWAKTNILAFGSGSVANAATNPNGLQTADLIVPNTTSGVHTVDQTSYAIVSNTPYQSSVYVKAAGYSKIGLLDNAAANRWATFNLSGSGSVIGNGASATGAIMALSDGWYRVSLSENAGTTALAFTIYVMNDAYTSGNPSSYSYAGNGTSGIYLWGAQLSDSASLDTYVPQYGAAVTSAAYYAPRLDYDGATLAAKGLLVEELRVNLLLQSNAFDNAAWTPGFLTVTANAAVSPDGTSSADAIVEDNTNNQHTIYQAVTVSASTTYTSSFYVKRGAGTRDVYLQINLSGGTSGAGFVWYNLSTGVASVASVLSGTFSSTGGTMVPVGNDWYRCTLTFTTNAGNTTAVLFHSIYNAARVYTGDNTSSLYLYGAQLDSVTGGNAPFATSYIPTGSATATRTADVASVSTQAFPYSATEGTLVASGSFISLTDTGVHVMASLNNNASTNSVNIYRQSASMQVNAFASGSLSAGYTVSASTDPIKAAMAYKLNDMNAAVNGTAQTTDTTAALPTGIDRLDIGRMWAVQPGNGWIRQITYIPRRLSNAELASRTAA